MGLELVTNHVVDGNHAEDGSFADAGLNIVVSLQKKEQ